MHIATKRTILIVEDEALIAMNGANILGRYGYDTVIAMSGREAVDIVRERSDIDLILMDIDLGAGMDGTEAAGIILRERDLPLVFLSSHTEREVVEKTEGITSYGYVVKNTGETVLIASIKMAFRLYDSKKKEKEKEEALRKSEERLRFAMETSNIGVWELNLEDHTAFRSLRHDRIFGYNELLGEWTYEMFLDHVVPDDRGDVDRSFQHAMETLSDWSFECRIRRIDGQVRWIWAAGRHQPSSSGAAWRMAGIVQDITERKLSEGELRIHRRIVENMAEGIMLARTSDGIIVYANETYEGIFGYGPGELAGKHVSILNAPDDRTPERIAEEIINTLMSGETWKGEIRNVKKDGSVFWCRAHVSEMDSPEFGKVWITVQDDITEEKWVKDALKESEDKYRTLAEHTHDWVYWMLPDGSYRYVSPSCERATGYGPDDFLNDPVIMEQLVYPEDREFVLSHMRDPGEKADTDRPFDFRIVDRDGSLRWISHRCSPVFDQEGGYLGRRGNNRDVTAQKNALEALRKSEELYHTLFTLTTHGVVYQDGDGKIIDANPAAEKILGLTTDQMIGRTSSDQRWKALRLNGEEFPGEEHPSMEALMTGKKVVGTMMGIYNSEENGTRWLLIDAVPQFLPGENAPYRVFTTFSDITEQVLREREVKRLSAEVLLSQEKERERIAAELHDSIGQILSAAGLNIRAYQLDPVKNASKIASGAEFIERAIVELREVYTSLYPSVLRDLGLEAAIKGLVNNVLEDNNINVDLNCDDCADLDRETTMHIFRILQEIVSNIIKHSRATSVRIYIGCSDGGNVSIEVSDNGKGFLLKRPGGPKQGYGLSNIRQRVDRMGGSLIISSMPGRGTRINIECGKAVK